MGDSRSTMNLLQMDGGALRLTASGGPSSGQCRPAPPPRHARRALDADRCAVCLQPVLFSAAKSICFSRSSRSQLLLEHATTAFPGPTTRSRPFDPATVLQNHRIVPTHALAVRCCRCAGRGEEGVGEGGTIFAFSGSILGDARRPLSAPCRAQRAVRSRRCVEKPSVCSLA